MWLDNVMNAHRIFTAALLAVTAAGAVTVAAPADAEARTPICRDSNGAAAGGSVYIDYRTTVFVCDVVPPQRLHIVNTPTAAACNDMGGHGWTAAHRICWDVDY